MEGRQGVPHSCLLHQSPSHHSSPGTPHTHHPKPRASRTLGSRTSRKGKTHMWAVQVLFSLVQKPAGSRTPESEGSWLARACPTSREKPRGLPWSLGSSLAPGRQGSMRDRKHHREDIYYLCGFVWHEEWFTGTLAPRIKTFLSSVVKRSPRRGPATRLGPTAENQRSSLLFLTQNSPWFPIYQPLPLLLLSSSLSKKKERALVLFI